MKICLIGCGFIARDAHVPALLLCQAQRGDLVLAACCDRDPERAEAMRREAGFLKRYADWKTMLAEEMPDAALLALPYQVSAPVAVEILEMGIPLLFEKPPGNNTAETLEIMRAYERTGTLHQVAFNRRHMPLVTRLMDEIDAGGRAVRSIDYRMYRVDRQDEHFETTAIHGIDLALHLAGERCASMRIEYGARDARGAPVSTVMQGRFQSGITAQLSFCPRAGHMLESLAVVTDGITYFLDLPVWNHDGYRGEMVRYEDGVETYRGPGPELLSGDIFAQTNGFYAQLSGFLRDISQGRQPRDQIATAIAPMELMDAMARGEAALAP